MAIAPIQPVPSPPEDICGIAPEVRVTIRLEIPHGAEKPHRKIGDSATIDLTSAAVDMPGCTHLGYVFGDAGIPTFDVVARYAPQWAVQPCAEVPVRDFSVHAD